jgi:hypothetical protein
MVSAAAGAAAAAAAMTLSLVARHCHVAAAAALAAVDGAHGFVAQHYKALLLGCGLLLAVL